MDEIVYKLVVGLFGWWLTAGGILLNYSINQFVIGFGDVFANQGIGFVVNTVWATIRDVFNLVFIFGLVFIGFKMILRVDDANSKRWLVSLVLAALLVNFSLFIAKFVTDFSNIVAVEIINMGLTTNVQTNNTGYTTVFWPNRTGDGVDIGSATKGIMRINTANDDGTISLANTGEGSNWPLIFGTMIVYIVGGFVFISAAIMLFLRAAVLIFLMIMSPFLFLGMVFPGLKSATSKLWKMLFSRAFFAPIYLMFLYVTLRVGGEYMAVIGGSANVAEAFQLDGVAGENSIGVTFGPFIIITAFLMISLVAAQRLGVEGGATAVKMGKSAMGSARKRVVGGTRRTAQFAVNQTAGRAARRVSDSAGRRVSRSLNNLQQLEGTTLRGRVARGLARTNAAQDVVGGAAKGMQNAKFGMKRTREEERKMRNTTNDQADRAMNFSNNQETPINGGSTAAEITARQEARRAQQAAVSDMTNEEILERARTNPQEVIGPEFASLLSDAQVKALTESGVLTNEQINDPDNGLRVNRDAGAFRDIIATLDNRNASEENLNEAMETLNRTMKSMSDERLQRMNPNLLSNAVVASKITDDQFDSIRQSGRVSAPNVENIRNSRTNARRQIIRNGSLGNLASPGASSVGFQDRQRRSLFRDAKAAGKMPATLLNETNSAPLLTPRIVEEFLNNNPNEADIQLVRDNIEYQIGSGAAAPGYVDGFRNWTRRTVAGRSFGLTI